MNRIGRGLFWGLVALFGLVGTPALAQDPLPPPPAPPEAPNQGLAYLIISLDDEFGAETGTIVVPLGLFVGDSVGDATFTPADAPFVPVQFLPGDVTFADLEGNATTIIGAFQEDNTGAEIHLINSLEDFVHDDVEAAIYNATRYDGEGQTFSDLFWDSADEEPLFPTTTEIAEFIAGFPPLSDGEYEFDPVEAVHDAIFGTDEELTVPDPGSPTVECEGELFPHDEMPTPIFEYAFVVNETGAFNLELCDEIIEVEIDITPTSSSPNSINLKKKGLLAVAILSSDDFDATEVGAGTVELGGVPAEKDSIDDVNDDGLDDLVLHFSVPDLVEGGFLNEDTTRLTLVGELSEGVCIRGSDSVSVTANNKK